MPGRLAVDFGTSNTVLAVWDEQKQQGVPLFVPDYGARLTVPGEESQPIALVPSLIHYASGEDSSEGEGTARWLGQQVRQQNLLDAESTFRWMKRYIAHRSPIKRRLSGREVSYFDAGREFLSTLLAFAASDQDLQGEEISLTVPVESYEHYEDWLGGVAEAAGLPRFRLIDEPSAAALGYGAHIQPGHVYLIFDFGGGTLDVAVVLIEEEETLVNTASGRRCRVLGKAGTELGGMVFDSWLFQEVLKRTGRRDSDDDVRRLSRALLMECERAKEQLSAHDRADVAVVDPDTGAVLSAEFTRSEFEDLLDEHEAYTRLDQTIRRALNLARERGYNEDNIQAVLMVGGSSLIPSIQRSVQRMFGRERVLRHRPLDAVARGAAAFVAGVDFYDHIQHDYAIRYVDARGGYDYRTLVQRGTAYPTNEPIARLTIKATHDGQTHLGLAIFELGEQRGSVSRGANTSGGMELVFDPTGAARMVALTPDEEERRTYFWINEDTPTFLEAQPPARQGEARFEVEFGIDGNKRLLVTVRDLLDDKLTHKEYPVVKLT